MLFKNRNKVKQQGFSLIEVLIGLSILAIALTAGIKALTQSVQTQTTLQQQYLAMLSANDALNKIYLQKVWPEFEVYKANCSQLNVPLVCIRSRLSPHPIHYSDGWSLKSISRVQLTQPRHKNSDSPNSPLLSSTI